MSSSSSPTQSNKENVHFGLAREAQWASTIIQALTQVKDAQSTETKSVVPRISIARAKGLAFFEQNKYGALVSITKSRGFLIRNLGTWKDGVPQWSAPVFLEMTTGGLGLSLGYETAFTCIVLNTDEAIDDLVRGKPVLGFDMRLQSSESPTAHDHTLQLGDEMDDEEEVVVYSVAQGRMLDVSFQGGAMVCSGDNAKYFTQASAEQLLSGQVPAPREFANVYSVVNGLATAGHVLLGKLRDAGVRVVDVSRAPAGYRSR